MRNLIVISMATALATTAVPAIAQMSDTEKARLEERLSELELQVKVAEKEAELAKQVAAETKSLIDGFNLPSFENSTTLSGAKAGQMETTLLTMALVRDLGLQMGPAIAAHVGHTPVVLLEGTEQIPWSTALLIEGQLEDATKALDDVTKSLGEGKVMGLGAGLLVGAISAVGELISTETTITGIEVSIKDSLLRRVAATHLTAPRRPDAILSAKDSPILKAYKKFQESINRLEALELDDEDAKKRRAEALAPAKAMRKALAKPGKDGMVPLFQLARYAKILGDGAKVVRIYSDFSGGSAVHRNNLWISLGLEDPLRLAGGLVAGYEISDPVNGTVTTGDIFACRTRGISFGELSRKDGSVLEEPRKNSEGNFISRCLSLATAPRRGG